MSDAHIQTSRVDFPLTRLICDLHSASMARRMAADPVLAAAHYGVSMNIAHFYIKEARQTDDVWPSKTGGRK